jgi:hypothetical protein
MAGEEALAAAKEWAAAVRLARLKGGPDGESAYPRMGTNSRDRALLRSGGMNRPLCPVILTLRCGDVGGKGYCAPSLGVVMSTRFGPLLEASRPVNREQYEEWFPDDDFAALLAEARQQEKTLRGLIKAWRPKVRVDDQSQS